MILEYSMIGGSTAKYYMILVVREYAHLIMGEVMVGMYLAYPMYLTYQRYLIYCLYIHCKKHKSTYFARTCGFNLTICMVIDSNRMYCLRYNMVYHLRMRICKAHCKMVCKMVYIKVHH